MGQKYGRLTIEERNQFYALRKANIPIIEIAKQLNRSRTTLCNELNRNTGGRGYRPKQAQEFARQRQVEKVGPLKMTPEVIAYIENKLRRQWSPEQIALVQHRLNSRPRKCLGFKLPDAVYFGKVAWQIKNNVVVNRDGVEKIFLFRGYGLDYLFFCEFCCS